MKLLKSSVVLLSANPSALFSNWKSTIDSWLNGAIDYLLIPISITVVASILIYNIVQIAVAYKKNQGESYIPYIVAILICTIVIALLFTKNIWWSSLVP